jgi:ABC-type multidrug transport system fused ATPase/permease subunit
LQQFIDACFICGSKVTNTATTAVYHASLRLQLQKIHPPRTIGEITNIQSKDAASLRDFVVFAHNLWACPLTILCCIFLIVRLLGMTRLLSLSSHTPRAGLVGLISVIVLVLFIPIESCVADKSRTNKKTVSKLSDSRMGLVYELIDGIRTLKLTGLRDIVQGRISTERNKELHSAWKGRLLDASNLILSRFVPVIVIALTFGLYLVYGSEGSLDAPKVFATLSLINIMGRPIMVIPKCISLYSGCLVSLARLESILRLGEGGDNDTESQPLAALACSNPSIKLSNLTVVRSSKDGSSTSPLQNISFSLQGAGLVMVVGDNGSGKTTLLHAILNEAPLSPESHVSITTSTSVGIDHSPRIAYCGHDAWILRDTVKKNIVLGDPSFIAHGYIDEARYDDVVRTCSLEQDISHWPTGDLTVVGEKGVTISGGQKARVSLARALYSQAPIILLDCPLSGLDKEVGHRVFFEAIKKTSENKLVIMVTHQLDLLPHCNRLLVLQGGALIYNGSHQDLNSSETTRSTLIQIRNHDTEAALPEVGTGLN